MGELAESPPRDGTSLRLTDPTSESLGLASSIACPPDIVVSNAGGVLCDTRDTEAGISRPSWPHIGRSFTARHPDGNEERAVVFIRSERGHVGFPEAPTPPQSAAWLHETLLLIQGTSPTEAVSCPTDTAGGSGRSHRREGLSPGTCRGRVPKPSLCFATVSLHVPATGFVSARGKARNR